MAGPSCPLCGARSARFLRAVANRDVTTEKAFPIISLSICRRCGLVHQNPRGSRAKMERLYASLEDKAGGAVTLAESAARLAAVRAFRPPPARLLEAGCSDGTFLALARDAGYSVCGVEPSRANLKKARAHKGLELHAGFLESFRPRERFDIACHFYVLEYSFEPRRFLRAVRRLLKPGGAMLFEVPDGGAFAKLPFANSLFSHQDMCVFTRGTLEAMLRVCGFSPKRFAKASKSYGMRAAAVPAAPSRRGPSQFKNGMTAMRRYFSRRDVLLARLEQRVRSFKPSLEKRSGPIVIFGAGENGRIVTSTRLGGGRELVFCDSNTALQGSRVDGYRVVSPRRVPALRPALVVAASIDYQDDMVRQMRGLGVPGERIVKLYEGF